MSIPNWQNFENKVADIFKLFGYEVVTNTKVDSAQTDCIASTKNRFKPTILIECKYHDDIKSNVGINEVENFKARVLSLRIKGVIDQGYLITNTGFTSSAKECITDMATCAFLTSYDELLFQLVDVDYYLKQYVEHYEKVNASKYVDLRIVDCKNLLELDFNHGLTLYAVNRRGVLACVTFEKSKSVFYYPVNLDNILYSSLRENTSSDLAYLLFDDPKQDSLVEEIKSNLSDWKNIALNDNNKGLKNIAKEVYNQCRLRTNDTIKEIKAKYFESYRDICVGEYNEKHIVMFSDFYNIFLENDQTFLILLGDFGSGKTSSLEFMMYKLAKAKLDNPNNPKIRIPLFLSLRNYNKVPDIDSLLINFFTTELGYSNINLQVFKKINELGNFVIILDGFDEMAKLVTPAERRLTFVEVCKLITSNNKLILSSRPGYFPDNNELSELLSRYTNKIGISVNEHCGINIPDNITIGCVQLMDNQKVLEYLKKNSIDKDKILKILGLRSINELASRPVLLNIICETYNEIKDVDLNGLDVKSLYDIYTNKWINREEDKGFFRLLIDSKKKAAFISLLAIQMHEQQRMTIHYTELDKVIQTYFNVTTQEQIDHFSHDIRTCSFLNRDDAGNYSFIHRSFQEYFVVREFNKGKDADYKGSFSVPFTMEMSNYMDFSNGDLQPVLELYNEIKAEKNNIVKTQRFEEAAKLRDYEKKIICECPLCWPDYSDNNTKFQEFKFGFQELKSKL